MDRITRSLLEEFIDQNQLGRLEDDEGFEHFCGFLVTSSHHSESFSSYDISVGGGGDCGIDCISIIVNGCLVTEPEEIGDLAETNGYLDVSFLFLQAERSASFEAAKIGQFGFGVQDFLSEKPSLPQNETVQLASRISDEIFNRSSLFKKGNPQCFLYYTTTGRWQEDANLQARRAAVVKDMQDLNIFRRVEFKCLGAETLQRLYQESKNAISAEIVFTERIVLPDLPGVEQAYVGVLPAPEFLKLVQNDNEEVLTSIFYDNVRHWQEWNPVNTEIRHTLEDESQKRYFPLLNNGVTVVAKRVNATENRFLIQDYQVVNGCQTSYVLHETRTHLSQDVLVPVRLIATEDVNIRNRIIKATNRQTEITVDQLFALSDFPKTLEAYFRTFPGKRKLHYERRSRQYSAESGVEKVRIVDMRTLVRAFASMFLEIPHRTTRNYKALLKGIDTDIFNKDHRLEPYYVAAYAHYRLEFLFRNQMLPSGLKPARYHILLAYRMLVHSGVLPQMNSGEMRLICEGLTETLWDDDKCKDLFEEAVKHVEAVAAGNLDRDNIRTEPFTEHLIGRLRKEE